VSLQFDLYAAGVLAPGIDTLADVFALRRGVCARAGTAAALPAPQSLPANERRRASQVVRLTLACAERALASCPFPVDRLRMVFASDEGTGEVCQQMLETLATTRQVSPLLFHNSVHNAPSGYFSIAHRNRQSATSVSLGAQSFAAGLLCAATEARTTGQPVLLLAYDPEMTDPLNGLLPIGQATASAWIIATKGSSTSEPMASFALSLHPAPGGDAPARPGWLPAAWAANSSAEALVALSLLDEATPRQHVCELRLGAQVLRLERVAGATAC
jgi:hypothetical protein